MKGDTDMNVFDYVYGFVTEDGRVGVVRADSYFDAVDRIIDYTNGNVNKILPLNELDNDYGVIVFNERRD